MLKGSTLVCGVWTLPEQWTKDTKGRTRFSKHFVGLTKAPGTISTTNWNHGDEHKIPILQEYIDKSLEIPEESVAFIWSETGIENMKTLRSTPTYISKGKNLGKSNATNMITQAISEANSKWRKNVRKSGYTSDKESLNNTIVLQIRPMALHELPPQNEKSPFDLTKTNLWNEGDQVFIGRKIDGNRMMAKWDDVKGVILYGRGGDEPPNRLEHIRGQLKFIFTKYPKLVIDGEIYSHGISHSEINGTYMKVDKDSSGMDFVVFDVIRPSADNSEDTLGGYNNRIELLRQIFDVFDSVDIPNIKLNDSELVSTSDEIETIYKKYLSENYEGAVVRHFDSLYEIGTTKEIRSKGSLKLKPEFDAEFDIVGYKDGKGRDKGALVWILKMPIGMAPSGVNLNKVPKDFSARPMGSIDSRKELFSKMESQFESDFKGKPMRIVYTDKTKYGVPRFPRAIGIRKQKN